MKPTVDQLAPHQRSDIYCPICAVKHRFNESTPCDYLHDLPLFKHLEHDWHLFNEQLWRKQVDANFADVRGR